MTTTTTTTTTRQDDNMSNDDDMMTPEELSNMLASMTPAQRLEWFDWADAPQFDDEGNLLPMSPADRRRRALTPSHLRDDSWRKLAGE